MIIEDCFEKRIGSIIFSKQALKNIIKDMEVDCLEEMEVAAYKDIETEEIRFEIIYYQEE